MRLLQNAELVEFCREYVTGSMQPGCSELDVRIGRDAWLERRPQPARRNVLLTKDSLDGMFQPVTLGETELGLPSGVFILAATEEEFRLPPTVMGLFTLRSFAAKRGMGQAASLVLKPGWSGNLIMELTNQLQHHELLVKRGDPVGQVQFFHIGSAGVE